MENFYITTAIDYPSGLPHIGHAYEKIVADVIARWKRIEGKNVFFLTGTDEHGQKIYKKAKEAGKNPKQYVDDTVKHFKKLCKVLEISNNDFIRTTDKKHVKAAEHIYNKVNDSGKIYKGEYEGLYCVDCETYYAESDARDGKCPTHKKDLENLKEESYFFKMSEYEKVLIDYLKKNKDAIKPDFKRIEVLNRLKEGLKDLSVSRTSFDWGVKVPKDDKHYMYVWFDALTNYISGIGYPDNKYKKYWPADVHIIGKDIIWHHYTIWHSILRAAGVDVPKTVFVHGFVNVKGEKMSKSSGTVVDPFKLVEKYGVDALRYYLVRNIPNGQDGDFSEDELKERYNNELANSLGNLVSRTISLVEKHFDGKIPKGKNELSFDFKKYINYMNNYELHHAVAEAFRFVGIVNKYIDDKKPWKAADKENILYTALDCIRMICILVYPVIPSSAEKIAKQINCEIGGVKELKFNILQNKKINKGGIIFKKID